MNQEATPIVSHLDVLDRVVGLDGAEVLDIGCGDGALARAMRKRGARVWGVEPVQALVDAFNRDVAEKEGRAEVAGAEALPFGDARFDAALFFNSLHHIEVRRMDAALDEAWRVARPDGGLLLAVEPLAEGPYFDLIRAVEDETEVRAQALAALDAFARRAGVEPHRERYTAGVVHQDPDALRRKLLKADAGRAQVLEDMGDELDARFHGLGDPSLRGMRFRQPIILYAFKK